MKNRLTPLLLLVLASIGLQAQDFHKAEDILVRLESTLKPEGKQPPRAAQPPPGDSLQGDAVTRSLAERIAILEKRVFALGQPVQAARDTSLLSATVVDVRKALEALKSPSPGAKFPSVKTGLLGQFQACAAQEQSTAAQDLDPGYHRHWQRQMYLRRMRVLVGGSVSPQTSFFFESDAVNIGKVSAGGTKANAVTMYVQDAQIQHVFAPEFSVIAGLQLVGITRNSLQSAATLMGLNYGTYQFVPTGPLDNSVGRDVGVNFRGFLGDERLEYRAGVFSGRNLDLFSPFRGTVRVQYNFLDREKGFFYNGTCLGAAKNIAVGGGYDVQGSYRGYALDAMADLPVNESFWLTVSAGIALYDGGGSDRDSTCFTGAIPRQTVTFLEAGVLLRNISLQPYVKYESQSVHATVARQVGATTATLDLQNALRSNDRSGIGVNYFLTGHQASVKLLYEFVGRKRLMIDKVNCEHVTTGECTLQIQFFMY